jgi:hypothetical protein
MMKHRSYAVLVALAVSLTLHAAAAKTLHFAGLDWTVKEGHGLGPGPCDWKESNVFVDAGGDLHLRISHDGGSWSCAEVESVRSLGFGTYQWWVTGEIDTLDPNVVLGLFNYPPPEVGPDGTNEIDIEIAKWGIPDAPNLNFTVWPARAPIPPAGATFHFSLAGTDTTQRFTWASKSIYFQSLNGHRDDNRSPIGRWKLAPPFPARRIPQHPIPVHMNLWLVDGKPPTDGREVEIVIHGFTYKP